MEVSMDDVMVSVEERSLRGAEKKEAFHREAESRVQKFSFAPDARHEKPKDRTGYHWMAQTDTFRGVVQMIPKGGDINMHYHPSKDGFWMVLQGKATFYGMPDEPGNPDKVIGEFGPLEGVCMPRNSRYWFESTGVEELHILQLAIGNGQKTTSRVDVGFRSPDRQRAIHLGRPEEFERFGKPKKVT
jgi:mannose-6-phosphate isomerase-like protein (cupin superfamily)